MRILIANDQHWPMKSGVATAARTQAQGLSSLGHTVMVVAPSQTGRGYQERDENYDITRIRSFGLPFRKNLRVSVTYDREMRRIQANEQKAISSTLHLVNCSQASTSWPR